MVPTCGTPAVEREGGTDVGVPSDGQDISCLAHEGDACALVGPAELWAWGQPAPAAAGTATSASISETAVLGGSHRTGFYICAIVSAPNRAPLAVRCGAEWGSDSWVDEAGHARRAIRAFVRRIRPADA